jgi:hypothetical protein
LLSFVCIIPLLARHLHLIWAAAANPWIEQWFFRDSGWGSPPLQGVQGHRKFCCSAILKRWPSQFSALLSSESYVDLWNNIFYSHRFKI